MPILSATGIALIGISIVAAVALMLRTIRKYEVAANTGAVGEVRRSAISRAINRYEATNDNTLLTILEAGLVAGALLLLIFAREGNSAMLSTLGAVIIGVRVISAIVALVAALFDFPMVAERRTAMAIIFYSELLVGLILLWSGGNDTLLSLAGSVVIGIGILAALALLFGAVSGSTLSDAARRSL